MNQYIFEYKKPVVETKFGKLRGVTYGGINIFMGVKYAEAKRFQMPVEQQPWEGIRNAVDHGPVTPQMREHNPFAIYRGLHLLQKESEDCQNLNIWAPKNLNGSKKPVFVWMHGGGYTAGNALEEYSFEGHRLALYGDMVVVSINHRLNCIAHMNMADYGEEFKHSVNVGIADLVAALKWIHENIAAFGGDPDNVTICGHSGGGGKVQCMYQIEEAAPYFHRGIVLSGAMGHGDPNGQENSRKVAKAVMDELGITKENIDKVYEVSYKEIVAAVEKVTPELAKQGIRAGWWTPIADDYYRGQPDDVGFMPWSADKPIIYGTTLGEFPSCTIDPDEKEAMTEADKLAFINNRFGEHAGKLMELFKKAYPTHDIIDLVYLDPIFRPSTLNCLHQHAKNGKNNTYNFLFSYDAPEGGRIPVWHGGEVCYLFRNEDRVYVLNEAVYGEKFCNIFSTMAVNFSYTGDPNNKYLPKWEPFTDDHPRTMLIDCECEQVEDHDRELNELFGKANPRFGFGA